MENVKRNHAKLVELGLEGPVCEKSIKKRRGSHGHIGKRVFVVWNVCQPYTGTITQNDPFKSNPFFVEHDDGERQWEAAADWLIH